MVYGLTLALAVGVEGEGETSDFLSDHDRRVAVTAGAETGGACRESDCALSVSAEGMESSFTRVEGVCTARGRTGRLSTPERARGPVGMSAILGPAGGCFVAGGCGSSLLGISDGIWHSTLTVGSADGGS